MSENNSIKVAGLYKKVDSNGRSFLTGSLSPYVQISAFQNSFKKDPSHCDYWLVVTPKKTKPGSKQEPINNTDDL